MDGIKRVFEQSFPRPWKSEKDHIKKSIEKGCAYVAFDGKVTGYLAFMLWDWSRVLYLSSLAVSKTRRNKGIGTALLQKFFAEGKKRRVRRLFLDTKLMNVNAQRLYLQNGFVMAGEVRNCYKEKDEILFMSRKP